MLTDFVCKCLNDFERDRKLMKLMHALWASGALLCLQVTFKKEGLQKGHKKYVKATSPVILVVVRRNRVLKRSRGL